MSGDGHFELYPERDQETREKTGAYRWRFRAGNGKITADGSEAYTDRGGANRAVHDHVSAVAGVEPHPPILDVDD